jgi:hypothetical protein
LGLNLADRVSFSRDPSLPDALDQDPDVSGIRSLESSRAQINALRPDGLATWSLGGVAHCPIRVIGIV